MTNHRPSLGSLDGYIREMFLYVIVSYFHQSSLAHIRYIIGIYLIGPRTILIRVHNILISAQHLYLEHIHTITIAYLYFPHAEGMEKLLEPGARNQSLSKSAQILVISRFVSAL